MYPKYTFISLEKSCKYLQIRVDPGLKHLQPGNKQKKKRKSKMSHIEELPNCLQALLYRLTALPDEEHDTLLGDTHMQQKMTVDNHPQGRH